MPTVSVLRPISGVEVAVAVTVTVLVGVAGERPASFVQLTMLSGISLVLKHLCCIWKSRARASRCKATL